MLVVPRRGTLVCPIVMTEAVFLQSSVYRAAKPHLEKLWQKTDISSGPLRGTACNTAEKEAEEFVCHVCQCEPARRKSGRTG